MNAPPLTRVPLGVEQQLTLGSITDPSSCEFERPVELGKRSCSTPQSLINRVTTHRFAEIQRRERRSGVAQAGPTEHKLRRDLPSRELVAGLRPVLVLEAARDGGHPNLGPEGHPSGRCTNQHGVRVPTHDSPDPRSYRVACFRLGVYAW